MKATLPSTTPSTPDSGDDSGDGRGWPLPLSQSALRVCLSL